MIAAVTDWTVVFVIAVNAILAFTLRPLFARRIPWDGPLAPTTLDRLLEEKSHILRALKDLEHERRSGLIDEAEYEVARADFVERAALKNREIAKLTGADLGASAGEKKS